jgi:Domain of unknown function (DUF4301)
MFTQNDHYLLEKKKISLAEVEKQMQYFKDGIDFVQLVKPAIPGDGIEVFTDDKINSLITDFDRLKPNYSLMKFVPASGAASRMFKALFEAAEKLEKMSRSETQQFLLENKTVDLFFKQLEEYPFFEDLKEIAKEKGIDIDKTEDRASYFAILELFLTSSGLNYGNLPKGLLKFHKNNQTVYTAFQEHFEEVKPYLKDEKGDIYLHFTVSPEHRTLFEALANDLVQFYKKSGLNYHVSFSEQKLSTDTIAVDLENKPFRNEDGHIVFRPGGHGALLDNLNDLKHDLIFVSNIDNVAPSRLQGIRINYKKALAAYLLQLVIKIHSSLKEIEKVGLKAKSRKDALDILNQISVSDAEELNKLQDEEFKEMAFKLLNRPVRVCGMVKNVGEPGGGPFWVKTKDGRITKQIIESSQIDMDNPVQKELFQRSTHFNPVDLVCFIRDYKGKAFELSQFSDPDMGFISEKSHSGKTLKALELPGLWNGAMAHWITIFVEVPLETFSPVKTVFDLIREEHR